MAVEIRRNVSSSGSNRFLNIRGRCSIVASTTSKGVEKTLPETGNETSKIEIAEKETTLVLLVRDRMRSLVEPTRYLTALLVKVRAGIIGHKGACHHEKG